MLLRTILIGGLVVMLTSVTAMASHDRGSRSRVSFSIGFSSGHHHRFSHTHFGYSYGSYGHVPRSYYRPARVYVPHRVVHYAPPPVVVVERPIYYRPAPVVVYEPRPRYVYHVERSYRTLPAYTVESSYRTGYHARPYRQSVYHRGATHYPAPRYQYERQTTYFYGY